MAVSDAGPALLVLAASVARRYYLDDVSKVDIAAEYGLSRFQVARLLDAARAGGLVKIEIASDGAIDVDLSGRLREAYGLKHAVVVHATEHDGSVLRRELGHAAASLLSEIVSVNDVLGMAWSRSVSATASALTRLPPVPVVQLTGALARPDVADSSVDLVLHTARKFGGAAYFFYAPTVVPDAETAAALRRIPEVARTLQQFEAVTKAVIGLGLWSPGESTVFDALDEGARTELEPHGVCADMAGVLVDADGRPVDSPAVERMICPTAEQLRAIPEVIAIAYHAVRAPAVKAAIRSGAVDSVITHASLAQALLDT